MLSIEKVLQNYEDLMTKNGYSEAEKLENIQTIRNVLNYGSDPSADSLTYDDALQRYPALNTWCGIPRLFLDMFVEEYIIPQAVVTIDGNKHLISNIQDSEFYVKFDISNDTYDFDPNAEDAETKKYAFHDTLTRWSLFVIKVRDALNADRYKKLKGGHPDILRKYVSDDFFKNIDVVYADSQKIFY